MERRSFLTLPLVAGVAQGQVTESGFTPLTDWVIVDGPESAYTVEGNTITVHEHASFPAWLRSRRRYENFELRGEFFIKGWTDSGIYLRAAEHGKPTWTGMQVKVFHQKEANPSAYSVGSIFPVKAPLKVNVREGWNPVRILCDGPQVRVWINGELVQDFDAGRDSELRWRRRSGYVGIVGASVGCQFRGMEIKELPGAEQWTVLYGKKGDLSANWTISEGKPEFVEVGGVLRGDGAGHLRSNEKYLDFELDCYARGSSQHNGGILFRSAGRGEHPEAHYEIQLHNVEESHFPTGSLYHLKRAKYVVGQGDEWFYLQLRVKGQHATVRINGEEVMDYEGLTINEAGYIELQTHRKGYWVEFKEVRIRRI